MKILHVITSMAVGGAEALVCQLAPLFRDRGHDVEVALFDGSDTVLTQRLDQAGIKIHRFSRGGSVYNPMHIVRLARLMRKFDIVHTHNTSPQFFAAIAGVLCSVVLCTTEHTTSNRRRGSKWCVPIDRWMYGSYDKVICISRRAEENLREFIGSESDRICTINNGIDLRRISSATPIKDFKPAGTKAIVMVAGFRWEKDQDTLIRAMALLPEKFHLYLVGQGVRMSECEALAGSEGVAGRVHFLGLRTDVPDILASCDYAVMSSHFEGLSLSSVEGMAAGIPMLASDVDGLREVVGGAGILFGHADPESFAKEILKLDNDPEYYGMVAKRCLQKSRDYDINHMADSYCKIYSEICG